MSKIQECIKAQKEYCQENQLPNFASNGKCYNCFRNVFDDNGYNLEYARTKLITSCPFCHKSFCD